FLLRRSVDADLFPTIMALPASAGIARWDTLCSEPDCSTTPERAFRCFDSPVTRSTRDLKVAERRAVGPPRTAVAGSTATTATTALARRSFRVIELASRRESRGITPKGQLRAQPAPSQLNCDTSCFQLLHT